MIVVKIDLHPHGMAPYKPEHHLAKLLIWNDGTGTHEWGNYEAMLVHGSAPDHPSQLRDDDGVFAHATVEGYARSNRQTHIANLVAAVLDEMCPVELPGVGR